MEVYSWESHLHILDFHGFDFHGLTIAMFDYTRVPILMCPNGRKMSNTCGVDPSTLIFFLILVPRKSV